MPGKVLSILCCCTAFPTSTSSTTLISDVLGFLVSKTAGHVVLHVKSRTPWICAMPMRTNIHNYGDRMYTPAGIEKHLEGELTKRWEERTCLLLTHWSFLEHYAWLQPKNESIAAQYSTCSTSKEKRQPIKTTVHQRDSTVAYAVILTYEQLNGFCTIHLGHYILQLGALPYRRRSKPTKSN